MVNFYPPNGGEGKFRNAWASPKQTFFTGPPCACRDSKANNCQLSTDTSSPGFINVQTLASCDGGEPVPTAPTTPRPTPEPTMRGQTPSPVVQTPSPTEGGNNGSCP